MDKTKESKEVKGPIDENTLVANLAILVAQLTREFNGMGNAIGTLHQRVMVLEGTKPAAASPNGLAPAAKCELADCKSEVPAAEPKV